MVTGTPVVVGVVILGVAVAVLLMSLGRTPGLASKLSQDYTAMMAGSLAPTVQDADASTLAHALASEPPGVSAARREPRAGVRAARRPSPHVRRPSRGALVLPIDRRWTRCLAEAFEGRLEDLGPPDDTRQDDRVTLHVFRKTTQTIACWQEGPLVYALISTIPSETVIALARRHAARPARD